MRNHREYIETKIVNRLMKHGDHPVNDLVYQSLLSHLDGYIRHLSNKAQIPGFTPEDLRSFMHLKLYQMLSRGQYDPSVGQAQFFMRSFSNLMTDINRMSNRLVAAGVEPSEGQIVSYEMIKDHLGVLDIEDAKNEQRRINRQSERQERRLRQIIEQFSRKVRWRVYSLEGEA